MSKFKDALKENELHVDIFYLTTVRSNVETNSGVAVFLKSRQFKKFEYQCISWIGLLTLKRRSYNLTFEFSMTRVTITLFLGTIGIDA